MPYTFLGIAKDSTDSYGLGFIDVITPTPDGVSPAEEFIAANPAASPAMAAKANAMKR